MSSLRFLRTLRRSIRVSPRVYYCRRLATVADQPSTGFKIPIIDFSTFLAGNEASKQKTANEILDGFTSSGFIYLSNTSIPPQTISNVFKWSKKFFDLPQEEKLKLAWETPESNRGYVAPGREKVSRLLDEKEIDLIRAAAPDLKESMEIGKEPSDNYKVSSF
jgi:isopenicillin N synthase-like dioxygenase